MIGQIDNEDKETYILGDLNCNLLDQTNLDNDAKHLLRILEIYQLTQLITKPTRITQRSKSLLDVCITSCPEKIIHSDVFHVGLSDHSLVYAVRKINSLPKCNRTRETEVRNFKNFNSERFLEDLQAQPWAQLSFYAMWSCWKTMFLEVHDSHAPIRSKRVIKRPSLPWLSKDIGDKMLESDRLKRLAMIKKDDVSWAKYRSSRNIVNVALRKAKSAFYASQIENVTANPKKAWKTVNDILGRKQRTDDVREIKINDHSVTSPEEIAEKFNDYFTSIGRSLAENIHNIECNYSQFVNRVDVSFLFQPVSLSQVYKLLNSLSVCKASGIDKISAKVLKWAAPVVSESLMQIFNRSIVSHVFPNEWKVARVNALQKKGPRNMLDNYRPISILPVVSKVFERIL